MRRGRAARIVGGVVLAITLAGLPAVPAALGATRAQPAALTTVTLAGGDIVALPGPAR